MAENGYAPVRVKGRATFITSNQGQSGSFITTWRSSNLYPTRNNNLEILIGLLSFNKLYVEDVSLLTFLLFHTLSQFHAVLVDGPKCIFLSYAVCEVVK